MKFPDTVSGSQLQFHQVPIGGVNRANWEGSRMADSSRPKNLTNDPSDKNLRVMSPTTVFFMYFM